VGKIVTYLGLLLTGIGTIGILGPHMDLQRSGKMMAEVIGNDIGYRTEGVYSFRLQLRWTAPEGEQRTNITTPVRAATEEEARRKYRGAHLLAGRTYEFYTDAADPERIQPFKGYNWATFGKFGLFGLAGIVVFFTGMAITKKDREANATPESKPKR
jgi:hypothetical protein